MKAPEGLMFSKDHEWVKVEGTNARVGITDFAQQSLGEIVYIELPQQGEQVRQGSTLASVDSVKAASDVYSPVSGKAAEVNVALADTPEKLNLEPYESWIAVIEMDDISEIKALMNATQYDEFCASEE